MRLPAFLPTAVLLLVPVSAGAQHTVSREVSVLVAPQSAISANTAVSREISVYFAPESVIPANQAVSQEVTAFNAPFTGIPANAAVSIEISVNNDLGTLIPPNMAVTRELTVYLSPYQFTELTQALRIAAGLNPSSVDERLRLDVVIIPPSYNIIDILDAARIMYLQSVAPPPEDG